MTVYDDTYNFARILLKEILAYTKEHFRLVNRRWFTMSKNIR